MPNILDEVKLYYLGGLPETRNANLISKGRTFSVPPVGQYIAVPYFNAKDLIARNVVTTPAGGQYSVFTLDARAAQRAVQGPQAPVVTQMRPLNREELLAQLALLDANDAAEEIVDPNEPPMEVPPTAKVEEPVVADKGKDEGPKSSKKSEPKADKEEKK